MALLEAFHGFKFLAFCLSVQVALIDCCYWTRRDARNRRIRWCGVTLTGGDSSSSDTGVFLEGF
jgi:hypothetical protein